MEKLNVVLQYFSDFSEKQLQQFAALGELYNDWNSKINVVSRKDIDSLYLKHVLHSLAIAASVDFLPGTKIIDIGTGGGFPGIPLAIFFPEVEFHLVDSIAKKLKVVTEVSRAIGLTNVSTQHTRAEEIKNRKFDFVVSRAVAPLKDLWFWSYPLIKGGYEHTLANGLICLKGGDLAQEIAETNAKIKPNIISIDQIFLEEFFKEKYLIHVKK
jgi:16S rRNA (guanine527-N7)-methyltransferase